MKIITVSINDLQRSAISALLLSPNTSPSI